MPLARASSPSSRVMAPVSGSSSFSDEVASQSCQLSPPPPLHFSIPSLCSISKVNMLALFKPAPLQHSITNEAEFPLYSFAPHDSSLNVERALLKRVQTLAGVGSTLLNSIKDHPLHCFKFTPHGCILHAATISHNKHCLAFPCKKTVAIHIYIDGGYDWHR